MLYSPGYRNGAFAPSYAEASPKSDGEACSISGGCPCPDDCDSCGPCRAKRAAAGGRQAGVLTGTVVGMTRARYYGASENDRQRWLAEHHLDRRTFEAALQRGDTSGMGSEMELSGGGGEEIGDIPLEEQDFAPADEEIDPTRMTRSRWNSMTEAQRQAWMRDFSQNQRERNQMIAAAARDGFNGIVNYLRSRTDVEIAEINARRDVEIARVTGRDRAERDLVSERRRETSGGGGGGDGGAAKSSSAATLGIGALLVLALLRGGV